MSAGAHCGIVDGNQKITFHLALWRTTLLVALGWTFRWRRGKLVAQAHALLPIIANVISHDSYPYAANRVR